MRRGPTVALLGTAVTVAAGVAALVISVAMEASHVSTSETLFGALVPALLAALGLFLVIRAGATVVGGVFVGLGAFLALETLSLQAITDRLLDGDTRVAWRLIAAIASADWLVVFGALATLAIVFPTGRPASPAWARVLRLSSAAYAVAITAHVWAKSPNEGLLADVPGPFHAGSATVEKLQPFTFVLVLAALLAGAIAIVQRYRNAEGIERLQLKWLAWSTSVVPLTAATCATSFAVAGEFQEWLIGPLFVLSIVLPAVSIGIAVTRYRLYAIDRIINRTVVYLALSIVLAATWTGTAVGVGVIAGRGSSIATAAATLAAAVLFGPLRKRLQSAVDRRFARNRVSAVARVRAFEDAVRDGTADPEGVGAVIAAALGDATVVVLFRLPTSLSLVTSNGRPADEVAPSLMTTPIERRGHQIGLLVHDPALTSRGELLQSVLAAAGLTVEVARLRLELRIQLQEVQHSRERLIRAGFEERRRIERDLHDGAQQRLVSLGITLRRLQRSLPPGARVLGPALDDAVDEIGRAIHDLRTIAAGVRPARLDDGLQAALSELARTVEIDLDVRVDAEGLSAPIEEAAYFVACEAMTNAVKHASPSQITVRVARANGSLHLSVADDGIGGARVGAGSGLVGLLDRVHAHGGRLTIDSPAGQGTRLDVELPCES